MRIDQIIERSGPAGEPVFSFEFFPPKTPEGEANLYEALASLKALEPAFVSVTYGAGGGTRATTIEIVKRIKNEFGIEAMAHFTCAGHTREELRQVLDEIRDAGIENVIALRGDPPRGETEFKPTPGGLAHASELTALIAESYDFCIAGACYPEGHTDCPDPETDLQNLHLKVAAGARFLVTQLFFDNRDYFDFVDRARASGIDVPIVPGIMPVTNFEQIKRFTTLCGAKIPAGFLAQLESFQADDPDSVRDLGIAYATAQCAELLAEGAPGIHFYTLNKSPATRAILSALRAMKPWDRQGAKDRAVSPPQV